MPLEWYVIVSPFLNLLHINYHELSSNPIFLSILQTLRFREVLDNDRSKRGEHAAEIILASCSEAPLTLKRSLSQTCDPHRAYIYLELGDFEDTVGRINHGDFDVPKGKRSTNFLFKATLRYQWMRSGCIGTLLIGTSRQDLM